MLHLFPPYLLLGCGLTGRQASLLPRCVAPLCASEKPRLAKKYFAYWLTLFMSHHLSYTRAAMFSASRRVLRGGSWNNDTRNTRLSNRNRNNTDTRNNNNGFRLAREYAPMWEPEFMRLLTAA